MEKSIKSANKGWFLALILVQISALYLKMGLNARGKRALELANDFVDITGNSLKLNQNMTRIRFMSILITVGTDILSLPNVEVNFRNTMQVVLKEWKTELDRINQINVIGI